MSSSTGSGGVVGECAWWPAEAVVEADRGGECEEAAAEAGAEAVQGAGAVAFECEQVLQVWKIDSIRCRIGARWRPLPGSSLRRGRMIVAASRALSCSNSCPA